MPFQKGNPGRPKGCKNKRSLEVADDILRAYQELGGVDYLKGLDAKTFARLLERMIPRDLNVTGEVTHSFEDLLQVVREWQRGRERESKDVV